MKQTLLVVVIIVLGLAASGCFILSDAHIRQLEGDVGDGGGNGDAGPGFDDMCGAPSPRNILTQTTYNIQIDTNSLSNQVTSNCGGAETIGNDAFIAVDVQAAVYWHFHLRNDPSDPASAMRQPALYMLFAPGGSCDPRDCRFASDVCAGSGDEHFGFVADQAGRWYLGIDDRSGGGGKYVLDAIRPTCGDATRDHGEACDDGNVTNGDGCTSHCLRELTAELPDESEPNDNPTEANFLVLAGATEFVTRGAIGGPGACRYSDTFAVDVPPGAHVEVDVLASDGSVCSDSMLTAGYSLVLRNAAFISVVDGLVDAAGCATIRTGVLGGGLYYVTVTLPQEVMTSIPYRLRLRLT